MRLVQYEIESARRLGAVVGERVVDLTAVEPRAERVMDAFELALDAETSLADFLAPLALRSQVSYDYAEMLANRGATGPRLCPPVDHADPRRVLITGTGLTHLGSMQSRDEMHAAAAATDVPLTDSKKMFLMGIEGGKPAAGRRGTSPEWFYKGSGAVLRGHNQTLSIPPFTRDGGEEPEIVGCYAIDRRGDVRRLGFALGNEWSDHATESVNYLYLAPSKLRECSVGPELITECDFEHVELRCQVRRGGQTIYDSGPLTSGERNMCHSLANCEDHHFKYPQHRLAGDVHLHYFGTSKLSFRERGWKYEDGDEIRIEAPGFSAPLVNFVSTSGFDDSPVRIRPA